MSCFSKINYKNKLILSFLIITISFIFSRAPYFLWMPLPIITFDGFMMYSVAYDILHGNFIGFGIYPPGYILFIVLTEILNFNLYTILFIQSMVSFLSCLFLIYATYKYYRKLAIYASIALSVYMIDSATLWSDISLLTEPFYRDSIILIIALLIIALNSQKRITWIYFSLSLSLPSIFRPNGMYIYFIIPILIIYFYLNHKKFQYYLLLIAPIFFLNIAWSVFNYSSEGFFSPGNPGRLKIMNEITITEIKSNPSTAIKEKCKLFTQLVSCFADQRADFYFSILPELDKKYYKEDIIHNTATYYWPKSTAPGFSEIWYSNNILRNTTKYFMIPPSKDIEKMIYKEYYTYSNPYKDYSERFVLEKTHNNWLLLWHYYYLFHGYFFNNFIWLILFTTTFLYVSYNLIKSRMRDNIFVFLFILCLIYIMAIFSLAIFGWLHLRYIQVNEFVVYLTIAFLPLLFKKNTVKPNVK